MTKKIIYVIIGIVVVCAGVIIGKNLLKEDKTIETSKNYNNVINENKIANESNIIENKVENEIEDKVEDADEQKDIDEVKTSTENKENVNEESNKEKAIDIAKKDWGTDDAVYFEYEEIDTDGNYVISVRQKSTTKSIFWYTIDIENNKIIDE